MRSCRQGMLTKSCLWEWKQELFYMNSWRGQCLLLLALGYEIRIQLGPVYFWEAQDHLHILPKLWRSSASCLMTFTINVFRYKLVHIQLISCHSTNNDRHIYNRTMFSRVKHFKSWIRITLVQIKEITSHHLSCWNWSFTLILNLKISPTAANVTCRSYVIQFSKIKHVLRHMK